MAISEDLLVKFLELFTGYDKAYGQYKVKKAVEGEKASGKAYTIAGQPTEKNWREHLDGTGFGMGIIMLQENDTCRFGAIDVDDRGTDHVKLEAKIKSLGLPLVVCRSKSGGAHLYVFTYEDIPASILQRKLSEWCARLGYSNKTEIFPKQTSRFNEEDKGNWINLPYYDYSRTMRYCIIDGQPVGIERFLEYADEKKIGLDVFRETEYVAGTEEDDFYEAPPCIQFFEKHGGFPQGGMKNGMFNVGVYLRKRFPEDWKDKFEDYVRKMCEPPLKSEEVLGLIKQLSKKEYSYTCKQIPIESHCQRRLCLGRKFGVGGGHGTGSEETLDLVIHTRYVNGDRAKFSVEVNGKPIVVSTEELYGHDAFNRKCLALLGTMPVHMPSARWKNLIAEKVGAAEVIYEVEEATADGVLWSAIKEYFASNQVATKLEELRSGRIVIQNGRVGFYFRTLIEHLRNTKALGSSGKESEVAELLREKGAIFGEQRWVFEKNLSLIWIDVPLLDIEDLASELDLPEPPTREDHF